jgi:hypothetical protein
VRTDIPLADQIVQVGHACLEAGNRFEQPLNPCNLVVLSVPSERHLHEAVARIRFAGIECLVFYEPDEAMGYTAACTQPVRPNYRRVFKRFSLWGASSLPPEARGPPPAATLTHFSGF